MPYKSLGCVTLTPLRHLPTRIIELQTLAPPTRHQYPGALGKYLSQRQQIERLPRVSL